MNTYRIYICLAFMLSLTACITQTRHSRKRYQQKKQAQQNINTLIDTNSANLFSLQQPSNITALPATAQQTLDIVAPLNEETVYTPTPAEQKVPAPIFEEEETEDSIEFNFENAGLDNLVQQIQEIFEVIFISDEALQPLPQGKKSIKGNKISFKTHVPLSKKDAWNLFLSFL